MIRAVFRFLEKSLFDEKPAKTEQSFNRREDEFSRVMGLRGLLRALDTIPGPWGVVRKFTGWKCEKRRNFGVKNSSNARRLAPFI